MQAHVGLERRVSKWLRRQPVQEESFPRVACLFIRENEQNGSKEVLFARSPSGSTFFIPGVRRVTLDTNELDGTVDSKKQQDDKDKAVLMQKMKLDLNVDLLPESIQKFTSFAAPAFAKEEGTMVENHYFFADYRGILQQTPQIYALEWRTYESVGECTDADRAVMEQLRKEGIA